VLRTRLTERFGLDHPVISAPMGWAGGGRLAAAVSAAGGLGLIGGAYGDEAWLIPELEAAGNERVGCGFLTFRLRERLSLLDLALERAPAAMFLSFGDPEPYADRIRAAGVPLICQIQSVPDARRAIDVGADVVVAQGTEAGGHGEKRGTFTLVPEVADLIAGRATETLLCAAGGVGDGRGLAAALTLGADGILAGTRFWASEEALVHPNLQAAAVLATGDDTIRSVVIDVVKGFDVWPPRYDLRTLKSATTDRWHGREAELRSVADREIARFAAAAAAGDAREVGATVGEAIGLIHDVAPARTILERMVAEAEAILRNAPRWVAET
jgi:nitronate monooxygenase